LLLYGILVLPSGNQGESKVKKKRTPPTLADWDKLQSLNIFYYEKMVVK